MAAVTCPFCQSTEWEPLPKALVLREDNPLIVRGGGFSAEGFVCAGCGFIRLQLHEDADAGERAT